MGRNVRQICNRWKVSEIELWKIWESERMSVFSINELKECERVVEMIKELSVGVNGFSEDEITDTLCYFYYVEIYIS
jgi:hypothetical protein